ncbi:NAD-binding protein [Epithele typhae]|uniref:NAD-binding protein n=1 Tax=Epithele typhae TaxID=378194 RepID=UPI00200781BB|nr:NAD-binding protein [Epithele typhae]KAH9915806.1 NAD-binding protein [Epithele typhae]
MPRVALVTGGAQGLGEAIALKLAEEGLDVAVADIAQKEGQLEAVANAIRAKDAARLSSRATSRRRPTLSRYSTREREGSLLAGEALAKQMIKQGKGVLSSELAPHNITVIAYAPGFIKTPMISPKTPAGRLHDREKGTRLGLPDEFAVDEIDLIEQ